jgi:hypothetical protein
VREKILEGTVQVPDALKLETVGEADATAGMDGGLEQVVALDEENDPVCEKKTCERKRCCFYINRKKKIKKKTRTNKAQKGEKNRPTSQQSNNETS